MKSINPAIVLVSVLAGVSIATSALAQATPPPVPLPPALPGVTPVIPGPRIVQPTVAPTPLPIAPAPANPNALVWDAEMKESTPAPGDATANYTFWFTNTSAQEVVINSVRTSCGCTTAKLPVMPWHVAPGTNSPLEISVDLRGKSGVISKAVTVDSTAGVKSLIVKINLPTPGSPVGQALPGVPGQPAMHDVDRLKNMQVALADRQVVFKDAKCATCHADPAKNLVAGQQLYTAVCGICHDSVQRAALVPDLKVPKHETDMDYWKTWIANGGKQGSMMPAFAKQEGGPLTEQQIAALADYCVRTFQPRHASAPGSANATVQINPQPKTN